MEEQNKTSGKDQTSTINWEKIHSLVDSAGEKNKHGWEPSDEEVRKIFAARTKDLAKKKKKAFKRPYTASLYTSLYNGNY